MIKILIFALLLISSRIQAQVHPYSYFQPTTNGFIDMVAGQNMATYGNPQLVPAPVPGGYALTSDGSIQFGNLNYQYPTTGASETIVCWWLGTSSHANASIFSHQAGKIFHLDMGYSNNGNFDAEIALNFKYTSTKPYRQIGTADIELGINQFESYLNGAVFGPVPALNTWHEGILSWDAVAQTSTFWLDGVKIGSVLVPAPQLSGGNKGQLAMIGNYYDHDPSNSVIGLLGPMVLIASSVNDAQAQWLWNGGVGREWREYN